MKKSTPKAEAWLKIGVAHENYFYSFLTLWMSFNNLYSSKCGGAERDKIKAFLGDRVSEEIASRILCEHKESVSFLLSKPVSDMYNINRNTQCYIRMFSSADSRLQKLKALFMIIYQVRCNFAHGQKSPNRDRDHKLCLHSSDILKSVLFSILGDE